MQLTKLQTQVIVIMYKSGSTRAWSPIDIHHRGADSTFGGVGGVMKRMYNLDVLERTQRATMSKKVPAKYKLTTLGKKLAKEAITDVKK